MSLRNMSPHQMYYRMALEHTPLFRFAAEDAASARKWKDTAWPQVFATLGDFPARVPLNPECTACWTEDGVRKERWLIDVGPHCSAAFIIAFPPDHDSGKKFPALLCCHGHNYYGKGPVMGDRSSPERVANITKSNYDYGHQMAKSGFITFGIDLTGFGERSDSKLSGISQGRDWCNLYYLNATMLGMTSLSVNIAHCMAAIDFALTFSMVDSERLGVMGLSAGGTMSLWMGLCDERIKAVEIICYSDLWAHFGIHDLNYCGLQVAPGLFKLVDLPDLQGLLFPKPLLIDIGVYDDCFCVDNAMRCYRQLERIYSIAGYADHLELDSFSGPHAWSGSKSVAFFNKYV